MKKSEFERLYRRLYLPLGMYVLRLIGDVGESEDLVNEVFAAVWERICEGEEPENVKAYLYRAARNRAVSYLHAGERFDLLDESADTPSEEEMDTSERDARLWRALDRLPERCRMVFLLSKRDGLSNADIAAEMSISVKTVENQMTRAYRSLRAAYGLKSKDTSAPLPAIFFLPLL